MGREQLSNALMALGEGLDTIAQYRLMKQEKEGERAYQTEMRESQNAFQQRLLELQQAQGEKMFGLEREMRSEEREDKQLFDMEMFNKQAAIQERQFAQEMSARWAQIRASAASSGGGSNAASERQLTRQLGVYEKQVEMAASEYTGLQEAMNAEIKELGQDKMLALRPEQMKAAKDAIVERYQPQLIEAKGKINEGMKTYSEAVGIKKEDDFSGVKAEFSRPGAGQQQPMSGGMASTANAINEDRVTQAVDAASKQLGASMRPGTMPSETDLVAGFEKAGLTRAEAVKAARKLQRRASGDRFTQGR